MSAQGSKLTVNSRVAVHLDHAGFFTKESTFKAKLISGNDNSFEASVVNSRKIEKLFRSRSPPMRANASIAPGLSHRLNNQHARHYGNAREVAGELRLINRNVFNGNQFIHTVGLKYTVNQKERITVRQKPHDVINVLHIISQLKNQS